MADCIKNGISIIYERKQTMYYLTTTAKRKNAKRHIFEKHYSLEYLRSYARLLNKCYKIEIYENSGRAPWKLVETINE